MIRMASLEELEEGWRSSVPAPSPGGSVRLICTRVGDGAHECPQRVVLTPERGIEGDRWSLGASPDPACQVTLIAERVVDLIARGGQPRHGAGDNFVMDLDLSESALPVGARLRIGSALLQVSAVPHTGCQKFRERFGVDALRWVNRDINRPLRLRGVNCRILEAGSVAIGDRALVVTASD